ncbi:sulfate transporter [Legionella sainthelensi]|uniref:SulP family inorganic anion transporter n=1 Tax=Legionella sainthelensi TaxID=28087 RepID=UPI000E20B858|nr:SulP family inorganic anion transporter [Legionella sainthelensi]VEB36030.1 sulfate transporter [Legionella sainthelensi]
MTRSQLITAAMAGLIIGIDNIISIIAFSSIIYQGILNNYVPMIINLFILSLIIIGTNSLLRSKINYAIAQFQDEAAILYATLAIIIYQNLPVGTSTEVIFTTTLIIIGLTTFISGFTFYLVGKFELGNIIRYLPYPVICGFFAATGRLIFSANLDLLVGQSIDYYHWVLWFSPEILLHWLPPLLAAFLIFFLKMKFKSSYILQGVFFLLIVLFYLVLYAMNITIAEADTQGFMLVSFNNISTSQSLNFHLSSFHFFFSLDLLNCIGLIILLTFIALLLNVSSLEFVTETSIDLNQELKITGQANMASGLLGGIIGYLSVSATSFVKEQGKSKITGFIALVPAAIVFFLGQQTIAFLPKLIIGAYLFYIAINFLYDWLIATWKVVSVSEYSIILLIVATSIFFNIIVAVGLGIIISTILFAFRYSMVNPIKHQFSGAIFHSSFIRKPALNKILAQHRDKIQYFKLQGFLFFGSVYNITKTIEKLSHIDYIILDFELTTNIDSSIVILFKNLKQLALKNKIKFVFCSMNDDMHASITNLSNLEKDTNWLMFFKDREQAFQWCENQLIDKYLHLHLQDLTLENQLSDIGFSAELIKVIQENIQPSCYEEGALICKEGEKASNVLLVHRGQVNVYVGHKLILTVDSGNILGEIAMYTNKKRSATLIASQVTIIYEIDIEFIQKRSVITPEIIGQFHECMAKIMASRIIAQNKRMKVFDKF